MQFELIDKSGHISFEQFKVQQPALSTQVAARKRRGPSRTRMGPGNSRRTKMAVLYDDNFGFWDIDESEERAFFKLVRSLSVDTNCVRCGRSVRLMPQRTMCATCASAVEYGAPASLGQYNLGQPASVDKPRRSPRKQHRPKPR
jgi:hypothetical protein